MTLTSLSALGASVRWRLFRLEILTMPSSPQHDLMPVLRYFENTYVGELILIRPDGSVMRRRSLFPIAMWSVYDRTVNGEARTNNFSEAAHKRLQTEFGVHHPNIWRFIDGLKKVQHHKDMLLSRFESGNPSRNTRNRYVRIDEGLAKLVNEFNIYPVVTYLRG